MVQMLNIVRVYRCTRIESIEVLSKPKTDAADASAPAAN
jgi:hypothetical protein